MFNQFFVNLFSRLIFYKLKGEIHTFAQKCIHFCALLLSPPTRVAWIETLRCSSCSFSSSSRHPHGWRGWQSSSLHYAVIMNPCRAQMGVGCWIEYGGKCVWCVTFSYSTQSHNAQSPLAYHAGKGRFLFQFEKSIPSGYAFCLFRN